MEDSAHTLLLCIYRDMPVPRMAGKVMHKLHDILVITVYADRCDGMPEKMNRIGFWMKRNYLLTLLGL